MTNKPEPLIAYREMDTQCYQSVCDAGVDPMVARILASRPLDPRLNWERILSPKLKFLDHPQKLPDIDKACDRLLLAMENGEIIGIETDHDCDGQTSHAVLFCALTECLGYPPEKIRSYIGHRLKEGYGLSDKVVDRILIDDPRPTLIITADNGSSDEERIARLKSHQIEVIVTDHHEIPQEGIPLSAIAVINPIRVDSDYPDKYIAGCMVAWLLMAALRQKLIEKEGVERPSLSHLLDFVAVGTVADCVSMAKSQNNRAVVAYGMKLIDNALRPCWQVLKPLLSQPFSSEDLGFKIGPLLNSDGRLACAFGSVSFLLAPNQEVAAKWIVHLQEQNQDRKSIQDKMTRDAMTQASTQYLKGQRGLCLFLEEGHPGVHGISASRVKDAFGRPVIIFSPKVGEPETLTGSGRSVEGLHLREALQCIADQASIIERFGGHQGAAGVSIKRVHFEQFSLLFEETVGKMIDNHQLGPKILIDGDLSGEKLSYDFIKKLYDQLEPFGREFEPPIFEVHAKVISFHSIGEKGVHLRVRLKTKEGEMEAVWFNARGSKEESWPIREGEIGQVIYSPRAQIFRHEKRLSCQIIHIKLLSLPDLP